MSASRLEGTGFPAIVTPNSLEWRDFADEYLDRINPVSHGDIEFSFQHAKEALERLPPRHNGDPAFAHSLMATIYLLEAGCIHPHHVMATLWHDVPEDNLPYLLGLQEKIDLESGAFPATYLPLEYSEEGLLIRHVGRDTYRIVRAVTKDESHGKSKEQKERDEFGYQLQLLEELPDSAIVKAPDRLHNVRTMPPDNPLRIFNKIVETRVGYVPIFRQGTLRYPVEGGVLLNQIERQLDLLEAGLPEEFKKRLPGAISRTTQRREDYFRNNAPFGVYFRSI